MNLLIHQKRHEIYETLNLCPELGMQEKLTHYKTACLYIEVSVTSK